MNLQSPAVVIIGGASGLDAESAMQAAIAGAKVAVVDVNMKRPEN